MKRFSIYKSSTGNQIAKKMFGDFPSSWKQRPCPICWNINQDINLENEYWGMCKHGYEKIVEKENVSISRKKKITDTKEVKQEFRTYKLPFLEELLNKTSRIYDFLEKYDYLDFRIIHFPDKEWTIHKYFNSGYF